ncbi:MAG: hypothetical protein GEU95_20530 [Rhizobiales bacterium]|nr:hypothetical protein [Hyphomicrobiales bacterium]
MKPGTRIEFKKAFTVWRKTEETVGLCDVCLAEAKERNEPLSVVGKARYRFPMQGETAGLCEDHFPEYVQVVDN